VFRQASYCPIALKDGGVDRRPGAFHKIDKAAFKAQRFFVVVATQHCQAFSNSIVDASEQRIKHRLARRPLR
jgi:hypothetical protein